MFERQILAKLEQWKTSSRRKPLILRGARQVGKTTVVNQFGKQFDNYLYFNMEMAENVRMFEMAIPLDDLVDMLFASQGKARTPGNTLIFIDEYEGIARGSCLALTGKEHVDQIVKGNCHLKHPDILGHLHVEIEIVVKLLAKLVDNRCLAHLPCTS